MGFSTKQVQTLRRSLNSRFVRTRQGGDGRELSYLEGWFVVSEANRIFGFDGWSRETLDSKCVLARENRGNFLAVYTARVRITVQADGIAIVREGHGTGEGRGTSPGEVHDVALKAAETDATKRALATFGRPFGLELYRKDRPRSRAGNRQRLQPNSALPSPPPRQGFHPDDTTPIPRPSTYYGRSQYAASREHIERHAPQPARAKLPPNRTCTVTPSTSQPQRDATDAPLAPASPGSGRIDKSVLTIGEPKRLRDKSHLKFVASQPCLVCGRQPSDPHHLRFAQPRAIGMKVSDEFTVPLCRGHHRQLHQVGNEVAWWEDIKINALEIAKTLWEESRGKSPKVP